jgi:hypothetical protein
LVEHGHHSDKQAYQQHVVTDCLPVQSISLLLVAPEAARGFQGLQVAEVVLAYRLQCQRQ